MQRLLPALTVFLVLAGVAWAAAPLRLNDAQMDTVTAGQVTETSGGLTLAPAIGAGLGLPKNFLFVINETSVQNLGSVTVSESPVPCIGCAVSETPVVCAGCFISNVGTENLFISAQFGP